MNWRVKIPAVNHHLRSILPCYTTQAGKHNSGFWLIINETHTLIVTWQGSVTIPHTLNVHNADW